MESEMTKEIKFNLIKSDSLIRQHCHICGCRGEREYIWCQVTEGEYKGTRVCTRCIKNRDFDEVIEKNAQSLEREVEYTRSMIGRLEIPSFEEYNQRTLEEESQYEKAI